MTNQSGSWSCFFSVEALTYGPQLARDRLRQAPCRLSVDVGVHVDGPPLAVAPRGRHDDVVVGDLVTPRYDLDRMHGE